MKRPRGLILDGLVGADVGGGAGGRALALRWTGQDGGRDLEAFWEMGRAQSWGAFRRACGLVVVALSWGLY